MKANSENVACSTCGEHKVEDAPCKCESTKSRYDLSISGARDKTYKAPTLGDLLRAQAQKGK